VSRPAPALLAAAVLAAGCGGGGGSAQDVLSKTAANLGKIRSGTLHVELVVTPSGQRLGGATGFRLDGPFSLSSGKRYPTAEIAYTQIANGKRATVRLISTGTHGFIEVNGKTYRLGPEQEEQLRSTGGDVTGGLTSLDISNWVVDPKAEQDGDIDRVTGELDVPAVVDGLSELARSFGRPLPPLDADDKKRLRDAAEDTRFELESGHDDHLLRHLLMEVDLGFDVPQVLQDVLGDVVGADLRFQLDIDDPNQPVDVQPPPNPLPASELPGAGG
jgi:hypothetical protein